MRYDKTIIYLCVFILFLGFKTGISSAGLTDSPWPCKGYDEQRTGQSPHVGAQTNTLKWSYPVGGLVKSSPSVGKDGVIYLGADNKVFALNPDGSLRWTYQIPTQTVIVSSPAIASDGTIYIGSGDFNLYAINSDGSLNWSYLTENGITSSPIIGTEGEIYFGSRYKVYALNPDGSLKWSYETEGLISSSPAIGSDGTIFIGNADGKFYALDPEDGSLQWVYPIGSRISSSAAIGADGTIYIGNGGYGFEGKLYALYPGGNLKWSYQPGGNVYSSPAVGSDGVIYVGNCGADPAYGASQGNNVFAINPDDGSVKWAYPVGDGNENSILSSPAIGADGTIYSGCDNGKVYALYPDGSLKWSYQTDGKVSSSPAIGADGTIYIGSLDGKIYAFGPITSVIFPGLNILSIPPGAEETYPNASSLWNLFINQNHQVVKFQAFSPDLSKWLAFRQTSPGVTHGEDFSLTRGKTILVYTNQTEVKNLEITFAPIQPEPPPQSLPQLSPGLNQLNLHFSLFGGSNNSEMNEEEWPQGQDLFQKFDQEEKESTSFMSLNPYQGKWRAKYPFFGLLAGPESKVGKRGYLVFMK